MTLLNNLISYWALRETGGSRADSHGSNTLTDNNTVLSAAGKLGLAADFVAASSQFLSRATNSTLETGNIDFSFAFWVNLTSLPANLAGFSFVTKDVDTPANSRDYTFDYFRNDGDPTNAGFRFYVNGLYLAVSGTNGFDSTATWYYVIGWHDAAADTVNLQIDNGTPISTGTGGVAPEVSVAQFRIGAREYAGNQDYSNARIDDVGFWKKVLTTNERTALWNNGNGLAYPFNTFQPARHRNNILIGGGVY